MSVKGYIFDYGGTLDTRGCHWGKVLWHAYEKAHVPVSEAQFREAYVYGERTLATNRIITPEFTFRDTLGKKIQLQLEYLCRQGLIEETAGFHDDILNTTYRFAKATTEESAKTLKAIAQKKPLVLVSNFYGNISAVLREFGFDGLFKGIIESAVVGIRKPDPRIFKLGVEKLNLKPEETMVVGDSYDKDILPAHSLGCKTAWIKGEGWTSEEPQNPVADIVISSLSELPI